MHRSLYFVVVSGVLGIIFLGLVPRERQFSVAGQTSQRSKPAEQVFFDDFNYTDAKKLAKHGWIIRTADGWPGIPGAKWPKDSVSLLPDGDARGNRILRMTSSTDGTPANTSQSQICHERKYLDGTYAARVRFSDQPVSGLAGDQIVE
ncbi:MAG: hydrolase, partial [Acidobacteriota bacterium]